MCKKALIICLGNPKVTNRARRLSLFLIAQNLSLDCICYDHNIDTSLKVSNYSFIIQKKGFLNISFIRRISRHIPSLLILISKYLSSFSEFVNDWHHNLITLRRSINSKTYEYIVVEDLKLLPFAFSVKGKSRILFDAREYYTRQFEDHLFWSLIEKPFRNYICAKYLQYCDLVISVSNGLKDEYRCEYGINSILVRSTPNYEDIKFHDCNHTIKLVHHGVANPNRKLHLMIEVMNQLDERFELDMFLNGSSKEILKLTNIADKTKRVRILSPVPSKNVLNTISNYDVGFCFLPPYTFNLKHCLPNKFFDCIQARLALAIGPSVEMKPIVEKYSCGVVSEDFTVGSMVRTLRKLNPDLVNIAKKNSHRAASDLCWEKESMVLNPFFDRK